MTKASLTSGKYPLSGRSIVLAVTLTILAAVAPHQASAKSAIKSCCFSPISRAEAAPVTSPLSEPTIETLGVGCGAKRYRNPHSHRCRGPADFGN
jgi:hypothetical protein